MLFRFHFLGVLRWLFGWFREVFSVVFSSNRFQPFTYFE